jgi:hypothetical protein
MFTSKTRVWLMWHFLSKWWWMERLYYSKIESSPVVLDLDPQHQSDECPDKVMECFDDSMHQENGNVECHH